MTKPTREQIESAVVAIEQGCTRGRFIRENSTARDDKETLQRLSGAYSAAMMQLRRDSEAFMTNRANQNWPDSEVITMPNYSIRCDQCEALMINGVFCHETGCPNTHSRYDAESDMWVKQRKCFECGCTVDADDPCCSDAESIRESDRMARDFDPDLD